MVKKLPLYVRCKDDQIAALLAIIGQKNDKKALIENGLSNNITHSFIGVIPGSANNYSFTPTPFSEQTRL